VGGSKQIEFSLQGPDQRELERLTLQILEKVRNIPGLVDLDSSVKPNKPSIAIKVLPESAADLGLSVAPISSALRTLIAGQTVGNWRAPDDQTYDVKVRLAQQPSGFRASVLQSACTRRLISHGSTGSNCADSRNNGFESNQPARFDARGFDQRQFIQKISR
jgi:multidrug efflux pump subunit AcrB